MADISGTFGKTVKQKVEKEGGAHKGGDDAYGQNHRCHQGAGQQVAGQQKYCAQKGRAGQYHPFAKTQQAPCDVRNNESHKGNHPKEGYSDRGNEGGHHDAEHAQAVDADAQTGGNLVAGMQGGKGKGVGQKPQKGGQQGQGHNANVLGRGFSEVAKHPGDDGCQFYIVGQVLEQGGG